MERKGARTVWLACLCSISLAPVTWGGPIEKCERHIKVFSWYTLEAQNAQLSPTQVYCTIQYHDSNIARLINVINNIPSFADALRVSTPRLDPLACSLHSPPYFVFFTNHNMTRPFNKKSSDLSQLGLDELFCHRQKSSLDICCVLSGCFQKWYA